MNERSDIDRVLRIWMADGPTTMPDRVVDVVADRIGRQPQKRVWRLPWRFPMNPIMKLAAAALTVALVLIVGWNVLPRRDPAVGGPQPSALPSPTASITPRPSPTPVRVSAALSVPVSYVLPNQWMVTNDDVSMLRIESMGGYDSFVAIVPDWVAASQSQCTADPEPGVGASVDDLVAWLSAHPGLVTTEPEPTTIGGLAGRTLDITVDPAWSGSCPGAVNLFTRAQMTGSGGTWVIPRAAKARVSVLEAAAGHTVTVYIQTNEASKFDGYIAASLRLIESLAFE